MTNFVYQRLCLNKDERVSVPQKPSDKHGHGLKMEDMDDPFVPEPKTPGYPLPKDFYVSIPKPEVIKPHDEGYKFG